METYLDEDDHERCDDCDELVDDCLCLCEDCGDYKIECACEPS